MTYSGGWAMQSNNFRDCCVLPELFCFLVKTMRATFIFWRNCEIKNSLCSASLTKNYVS